MKKISFVVQVKPIPQARPRFYVRQSGLKHFVGVYDIATCKDFKKTIAWHAKIKAIEEGLREPLKDPLVISLIFQMGENSKEKYHTKRPDLDNLAKAIKDALRGIIFKDDSQIVEAHLYKQYGEPEVRIEVSTKGGGSFERTNTQ